MIDTLTRIAQYKRAEITEQRARLSEAQWLDQAARASPPRGFAAALEAAFSPGRPALIAEIKKASPSKGLIRADFEPAELARAYARGGAACLSVLTDTPSFQGEDAHLAAARVACALPCLRKEFLLDPWQATQSRILGADAILIILALVDDTLAAALMARADALGMDTLVEAHDEAEMRRAAALGARLIGINNRDLRTFETDLSTFERLAPLAPADALLTAESGIASAKDAARMAAAGARAVLVGESLMRQDDVAHAARALTQAR